MEELVRLNKYISQSGFCSRRVADKHIEDGDVLINGKPTELGQKVASGDVVSVKGHTIAAKAEQIYIAFNKPVGITCTTDLKDKTNLIDYIGHSDRIFHIGRLDKDSEGLIFLTNDGDIVNKILRAENNHSKEYCVIVNKPVTDIFIKKMGSGVPILGTTTLPCKVRKIGSHGFEIRLTQGLNRQIRRMCTHFGYKVIKLRRTRIMNVKLGNIPYGKWRYLKKDEVRELLRLVESSAKN